MERTILSYFLAIFFSIVGSVPVSPTTEEEGCQLGDDLYQVGESWHPVLEPSGLEPCVTCHCTAPNRVVCDRRTCPDLNCETSIHVQNRCCPICAKKNGTTIQLPTTEAFEITTKNHCRFRDREYYDGQTFLGTRLVTGIENDNCVQCICSAGLIYCTRTCPEPECSNPTKHEGSCCPVCTQDEQQSMSKTNDISIPDVSATEEDSLNNFPPLLESRFEDFDSRSRGSDYYACVAADQTYSHGEQWHPLFAPFGRAHCVICICTFGESVCSRVECPAVEDMPCKNPVTVRGQCCKICEDEGERKNDSYVPLCLTEFETHLVYIYQPKVAYRDGISIVTYAVEDIARHTVRISQWEISLGTIEKYLVEDIPSVNFERAKETREHKSGRFHLTGATTQQRFDKLLRREVRLERRCREDCLASVLKLSKVLRASEVERSLNCSHTERTITKRRRDI